MAINFTYHQLLTIFVSRFDFYSVMKNLNIYLTISVLFLTFFSSQKLSAALDSLGIKTIEGKQYIIHKIEPKETLYALGRRYHVTVDKIIASNEEVKDGHNIDQIGRILYIPYEVKNFPNRNQNLAQNTSVSNSTNTTASIHAVKAGEKLYSIAALFKVQHDQLKKWNKLESDILSIGQELWVSNPSGLDSKSAQATSTKEADKETSTEIVHLVDIGETIYSISKKYGVAQTDIIELNDLKDNNIAVGQKLMVRKGSDVMVQDAPVEDGQEEEKPKAIYAQPDVQTFHLAKKGENYAQIADSYKLEEPDLKRWNKFQEPFAGGEVIQIVPPKMVEEKEKIIAASEKTIGSGTINSANKNRMHKVASGETLFSLAEQYKVAVEDLRKWNGLSNYQLRLGQELYVENPDALSIDSTEKDEIVEPETNFTEKRLTENPQKQDTKAYFTVEADDIPKIEKIKQQGIAELIQGSAGTEKYLALHRTAKIGTIMQVRNDLNDQIVFVRVLGKLPNTGIDEKVVIRISQKAFEKLGGVDYKFPVEISYLPLKD